MVTATPVGKSTQARAPGKLILSGEHAVVYGAPALVVSLPLYARARISTGVGEGIHLSLPDIGVETSCSLPQLQQHYQACCQRFAAFQQGDLDITQVLNSPHSLYLYTVQAWLNLGVQLPSEIRLDLQIHSELPTGAGMGSSAATVAALLVALSGHLQQPFPPEQLPAGQLSAQQLYRLVQEIECLQHGRSSGLDPAGCVFGGVQRFTHQQREVLDNIDLSGWYYADSGRPAMSTGSCTLAVKRKFADSDIWQRFEEVCQRLQQALVSQDAQAIARAVRENHRLLCDIGVVPEPVERLIGQLEQQGAAAKISGAGAVAGDQAGLLVIYSPQQAPVLPRLTLKPLTVDPAGARIE